MLLAIEVLVVKFVGRDRVRPATAANGLSPSAALALCVWQNTAHRAYLEGTKPSVSHCVIDPLPLPSRANEPFIPEHRQLLR
jgi:hypothetical protein